MKSFRPLFRATVNYWLVLSVAAIVLLLSWRLFRSDNHLSNISIMVESDSVTDDESDTLHINYANATKLSRFGFRPKIIVNLLKYRDAGGTIRDLEHLLKVRGIDSSLIVEKGHLIVFDRPKAIIEYYTPKTNTKHKAIYRPRKVSLYYTTEDSLLSLGINRSIIDSIMNYRERYILHGSMPLDSLTMLTPESFAQAMYGHISERKSFAIPEKKKHKRISVDINTATEAELCAVNGIAEKTARRIIERRAMLGGFVDLIQLTEIFTIDSARYAQIAPQLIISTSSIKHIKINEATKEEVLSHPYISKDLGRQLLRLRYRYKKLSREMVIPLLDNSPHDKWLLEYLEF